MDTHILEPYSRLSPSHLRDEFVGKTVLVTGGGYGIGAAIAQSFAQAGVGSIILVGRTEARLKATAAQLASYEKVRVTYAAADISSKSGVKSFFESLGASPDTLVNNAGYMAEPANFIDANLDDYWEAFNVNVFGTILVTQSFLQHRRATQEANASPAVVLNLNTIGAYSVRVPGLSSYGASKAALSRWSELVSVDVPETLARFISVHPGAVKTDMGIKSGLDGVFPNTNPKLAGDFVAWLASDEAKFLAGRFVWGNWDVDELLAKREEIVAKDLLRTALSTC